MYYLDQMHLCNNSIAGYSAMTNLINQYFLKWNSTKKHRSILIWWRKKHRAMVYLSISTQFILLFQKE